MRALQSILVGLALSACTGQLASDPSAVEGDALTVAAACRGNGCTRICDPRKPNQRNCIPAPTLLDAATPSDAGSPPPPPPPADAGTPVVDAGPTSRDAGVDAGPPPPTTCIGARRLWSDGFESGDYTNWTGRDYGGSWGDGCDRNWVATDNPHSGRYSNRSEITCAASSGIHRGYGGVQFSGDTPLPYYTNTGVGTLAPGGMVNTFWLWLDTPYSFGGGRWLSLFTAESDCGWAEEVITVSLEDSTNRLVPAHITNTGGTVTYSPGAPAFPLRRWVRVTIYINYYDGQMHIWQDGTSVVHATFRRPTNDICQWHWGAYASGDNNNIVLYEDDKSLWKLDSRWTDWSTEPWLEGGRVVPCSP